MARITLRHRLLDALTGAVIGLARLLPYGARLAAMGGFGHAVLGPLGLNRRIRANLRHVMPDLPEPEIRRICHEVGDTLGRAAIEIYSPESFLPVIAATPLRGPGLAALRAAQAAGRPAIIAPIHLANVAVGTAALAAQGFPAGQAYRTLSNPLTNARYESMIRQYGAEVFSVGPQGMAGMIAFLRRGGMLALLHDTHLPTGVPLDFMGKPAMTALSAAKLALKYDALLVPLYVTRRPDGVHFDIDIEAPIPPSDPLTMTQALNDSAAARVRAHPGQWFWAHRRWKGCPDG